MFQSNTRVHAAPIESHRLEFTGSGAEYFKVWLVNMLLTIVTLSLYTPFARRRKAQYFYSHTLVADSPLEFTAQAKKMVLGFALLVLLYLTFNLAADSGQDVIVSAFLIGGAALAPYLWGSAMRFRLGSTRWRGVRLAFTATWGEIYKASWPVFVVAVVGIAASLIGGMMASPKAWALLGFLVVIVVLLCVVRLEFNYKRLLVKRARLGLHAGRWKPVYGDFVRIWLKTIAVFAACVAAVGVLLVLFFGGSLVAMTGLRGAGALAVIVMIVSVFGGILLLFLASAPARAYREASMFHLTWNNLGISAIARFKSDLSVGAYVRLRVKNIFLTLFTLGFYRPFAAVSEYQMKTESVTLHVKGGLDQLVGQLTAQSGSLGDAVADAVGLDLIG